MFPTLEVGFAYSECLEKSEVQEASRRLETESKMCVEKEFKIKKRSQRLHVLSIVE